MKSRGALRRWVFIGVGVMVCLLLPGQVWAQSGSQSGSLDAEDISGLFSLVMVMAVLVFILVEGLLIFAIIRYRRRSDAEMPEQVHGNNRLEISWTVGSAILVVILFFFTLGFYQQPRGLAEEEDALTVQVIGHVWYWEYRYPNTGVTIISNDLESEDEFANLPLNVPAGRPAILEISSADVQHSFWVPELAGKVDAIPGRVQRLWFQVDEPRQYIGQCAEFCGQQHFRMLITINVMDSAEFAGWLDSEALAVAAAQQGNLEADALALEGDPVNGQVLYAGNLACQTCHSSDGTLIVGPTFQGLGQRAAERIEGVSAGQYIIESILRPNDYVVEGYVAGIMPQNFSERLSAQELADLLAFLREQ